VWIFGGEINGTPSSLLQQYKFDNSVTDLNSTNSPPNTVIGTACAVDTQYSSFFVYGGKTAPNATSCVSTLQEYNFVNKNWTQHNSSSVKSLEGASLTFYADAAGAQFLYLFGGSNNCQNMPGDDLYKFTIASKSWDGPINVTPKPPARFYHSAMINNGLMYIYGGQGANNALNDMWVYNISGNSWTQLNVSSSARTKVATAANANRFFLFGGSDSIGTSAVFNDLYQFVVQKDCYNTNCMNCVVTPNANCGWCPDNPANSQCIAGVGSKPFVAGTCAKVDNFSQDSNDCPEIGFPSWAIALIVIGGVVLIGIVVFAIMKFREKNEYQEIR